MDITKEKAKKLVEKAKEELDSASISWIDKKAKYYVDMLEELGCQEEADEVYKYYCNLFGEEPKE